MQFKRLLYLALLAQMAGSAMAADKTIKIYVKDEGTGAQLYVWQGTDQSPIILNGGWAGNFLSQTKETVAGIEYSVNEVKVDDAQNVKFILNRGDNKTKTPNITIGAQDVYVSFGTNNGYNLLYEPLKHDGNKIMAYAMVPNTWDKCYMYMWTDGNNNGWTATEGTQIGWEYDPNGAVYKNTYKCVYSGDNKSVYQNVLFHATDGGNKTNDLKFINGGIYYYGDTEMQSTPLVRTLDALTSRTFTAGQKSTLWLPFSLTQEEAQGLGKFYAFDSESEGTLTFKETTTVAAYTPYIFVPASSSKVFENLSSKSIETGEPTSVTKGNYKFVATSERATKVSSNATTYYGYKATNGNMVKVGETNGATVYPYMCYIEATTSSTQNARPSLAINLDGTVTKIDVAVDAVQQQKVYTLDGREVNGEKLTRGIYVSNGKKIIVK